VVLGRSKEIAHWPFGRSAGARILPIIRLPFCSVRASDRYGKAALRGSISTTRAEFAATSSIGPVRAVSTLRCRRDRHQIEIPSFGRRCEAGPVVGPEWLIRLLVGDEPLVDFLRGQLVRPDGRSISYAFASELTPALDDLSPRPSSVWCLLRFEIVMRATLTRVALLKCSTAACLPVERGGGACGQVARAKVRSFLSTGEVAQKDGHAAAR